MEEVQNMIKKDDLCKCGSSKKYGNFGSLFSLCIDLWYDRRKECCHPFAMGDLFRYMSALIKVSNHLALILPGALSRRPTRLDYSSSDSSAYGHT